MSGFRTFSKEHQMNVLRTISRENQPILKPTDVERATSCSESSATALHRFEAWLRTISERIRRPALSDGLDFTPGMDALRRACLPKSERQFIKNQLDLAKSYALGAMGESSKSSGAATFHLRQIVPRVKALLESIRCCGGCVAQPGFEFQTTQKNGCCQPQKQNTTGFIGKK